MKRLRKRRGSAYLTVVLVFIAVSLFTTLMVTTLNRSVFQMHSYALMMKARYLNYEAQEAAVAALLSGSSELLYSISETPRSDTLTHVSGSDYLGESTITLKKGEYPYYDATAWWVVAYVETAIPDPRADRLGEDYTYSGTVMVLLDNPIVQIYNADVDSLNNP